MALGFLPLAVVRMNFVQLRNSQLTRQLIGRFPALGDFFNYFSNNYLNGNFPPQIWNVFTRTMEIRTNNHVESYHRRWNQAVGVRHPSIWSFIRVVKDQENINRVTMQSIRNGEDPPTRRPKWRRLENQIQARKREYNDGDINIRQYWRAVSHLI